MWTGNAAEWLQSRGFLPGMGGPGDFRVGFNEGHMQATLPGGTNFNWGSQAAASRGGVGGSGAYDPSFTSHYYRPPGGAPMYGTPGLNSPANTSPGLTTPLPLLPPGIGGGGGPRGLPGVGMPQAFIGPTDQPYPAGPQGGGLGVGGMAMDGLMAATSGLDMLAPGAGAAAKIGIQLINRGIKYGGEVAGILTGGFLDTITPAGSNPKASIGNSWLGKAMGGLASAAPAVPNAAGGKPKGQDAQGKQQGGNTISITNNLTNNRATEDMVGNQIVREQSAMYAPSGAQ